MRHRFRQLALLALLTSLSHAADARTHYKQLGIVASGGDRVRLNAQTRRLLPRTSEVWLHLSTELSPEGEDVYLFAGRTSEFDADPNIGIVRNGSLAAHFNADGVFPRQPDDNDHDVRMWATYPTGMAEFALGSKKLIGVALHSVGDGSGTWFILIGFQDGAYQVVSTQVATHGRMNVTDSANGVIELWDGPIYSCVACETHYEITTLQWDRERFTQRSKRTTKNALDPNAVAALPFNQQEAQ